MRSPFAERSQLGTEACLHFDLIPGGDFEQDKATAKPVSGKASTNAKERNMKSVRVEVGQRLQAAPYTIQVRALDEANRVIGGIQRFEGATPIELARVLSMSMGICSNISKFLCLRTRGSEPG